MPFPSFVQVEVKRAEPRDSKAPGQLGPSQWGPRGILSAANGWTAQPAQGWQQSYGPQGEWERSPEIRARPVLSDKGTWTLYLSLEERR